jgi:hypothetical protein
MRAGSLERALEVQDDPLVDEEGVAVPVPHPRDGSGAHLLCRRGSSDQSGGDGDSLAVNTRRTTLVRRRRTAAPRTRRRRRQDCRSSHTHFARWHRSAMFA